MIGLGHLIIGRRIRKLLKDVIVQQRNQKMIKHINITTTFISVGFIFQAICFLFVLRYVENFTFEIYSIVCKALGEYMPMIMIAIQLSQT